MRRLLVGLLVHLLGRDLADSILGDLEEAAHARWPRSPVRAALWEHAQIAFVTVAAIVEHNRTVVRRRDDASEECAAWPARWWDQLRQDARHAVRQCRRSPGVTITAVLTLALGVGCTTAIFSVVNALLLRPLPYLDADRLVRIVERVPSHEVEERGGDTSSITVEDVLAVAASSRALDSVGLHASIARTLTTSDETIRVQGAQISPSIFTMLSARPMLGRTFRGGTEAPDEERAVVLSHSAWRRYAHGSPGIVSQRLTLDGESFTIVGVMGEEFAFPDRQTEFWIPFVVAPPLPARIPVLARLKAGTSLGQAHDDVDSLLKALRGTPLDGRATTFDLVGVQDAMVAPVKPAVKALTWSVGLVFLIACTNVASLLVARALARRREISVRRAIGAGRGRLVRQVLTESLLLAMAGGTIGVVLAIGVVDGLQTIGVGLLRQDLVPALSIPRLDEVEVDADALGFTLVASLVGGALFGLIPAVAHSRTKPLDLFHETHVSTMFGRQRLQSVLVVLQLAVAMTLFVAAGLQIHSFVKLSSVDPGYDPTNVLTFQVLRPDGSGSPTFDDDFVAALEALPQVRAVGYASSLPMVQSGFVSPIGRTQGPPPPPPAPGSAPTPEFPDTRVVGRGFLKALGIRIVEGRELRPAGESVGVREILVNRAFARTGFLGPHPLGQRVFAGGRPAEVVGIVEDVRQFGLDQEPTPQVVGAAEGAGGGYYAMKTAGPPASQVATVRQIARRLEPRAGLYNVATMEQILESSISQRRLYAVLLGWFAAIAGSLASLGLYAIVAHSIVTRTREIAIRIALGGRPGLVVGMIVREASRLTAIGVALGLGGAVALTQSLDSMLFGLTPLDPATYLAVSLLFAVVALAAAFAAARRATAGDPLTALRAE